MFGLIIGVGFIILGISYINLAFKLKRTKDMKLVKNNMVKIEKIKDKEGYINFNFRISLTIGIIEVLYGIISLLAKYNKSFNDVALIMNIITIFTIFGYIYKIMVKAPKFQE